MKIAIVGAGLAGLAASWNLLKHHQITLFDAKGIGGGASGIAAGLVHPYAGEQAKRSPDSSEALKDTLELLNAASNALGKKVYQADGMLRLALNEQQKKDFFACAEKHPDVHWLDPCPPYPCPAIFIESAILVDCPQYLQGLYLACQAKGLHYIQQKIHTLQELSAFDLILLTTGAELLPELSHLPLSQVKGQVLRLKWPGGLIKPIHPLNSKAYLIMQENNTCLLGSTFEHTFTHPLPDPAAAKKDLLPKIAPLYPDLNEVLECRSALRASTPARKPLIQKVSPKCWIYAGLGSKGLLYHAYYAKKLAKDLQ
jgi:glycine/D-amino acid oxidase-like deaminating enzyme